MPTFPCRSLFGAGFLAMALAGGPVLAQQTSTPWLAPSPPPDSTVLPQNHFAPRTAPAQNMPASQEVFDSQVIMPTGIAPYPINGQSTYPASYQITGPGTPPGSFPASGQGTSTAPGSFPMNGQGISTSPGSFPMNGQGTSTIPGGFSINGQVTNPATLPITGPATNSGADLPTPQTMVPQQWSPAAPPVQASPSLWVRMKRRMQDCFLGYPEEFKAPALGATIFPHFKTQVSNGDAGRMMLYEMDFESRTSDKLNLRGKDQLHKIASMLPRNFFPLIIERVPDSPALAEARRLAVLRELAMGSFPVPPERVIVGVPSAYGLNGLETQRIYHNLLEQIENGPQGGVQGGGASSGGAAGGAAGGGGNVTNVNVGGQSPGQGGIGGTTAGSQ